ncbi:MAG: riboflavin synthase [Flavobacteriaceae bacterium]|nr:riboflavin synthase [Flavobacteriaceae bacterium]
MFTGIIEELGEIVSLKTDKENIHLTVKSKISADLKIDQSLAHNGICLTVIDLNNNTHTVTAIKETIDKSNIGHLKIGDKVNLERAMKLGARLDGHIVQGHVDQIGKCTAIDEADGSWVFTFNYEDKYDNLTIEKGSVTVNGVSLTVVNSKNNSFSVAIIPFTFEHTNFGNIKVDDYVNLEFDVIGKYVAKLLVR